MADTGNVIYHVCALARSLARSLACALASALTCSCARACMAIMRLTPWFFVQHWEASASDVENKFIDYLCSRARTCFVAWKKNVPVCESVPKRPFIRTRTSLHSYARVLTHKYTCSGPSARLSPRSFALVGVRDP